MKILRFDSKTFLIAAFVTLPLFISCKDKETVVDAPKTVEEATLQQKKQALQNIAPTSTSTSTGGDVALNPPHGQPGHDCAVPVGAPLSGGGSSTTTPALNKTNSVPPTITGNGINPPHGQPGHKCEVKVGDPL